jgi:diguanylate cyclase (GGDEF)-like protein/PAS domain S-box-containing protein
LRDERPHLVEALALRALASLRDVLVVTDAEIRLRFVSDSVRRVMGLEPRDLLGRTLMDVVVPEERHFAEEMTASRFADRAGRTVTFRSRDGAGRVRHLEAMVDLLEEDGVFAGVVFNARDVTDRVEEELRLQRALAFRNALVELTNELLTHAEPEHFYQLALDRTIYLVRDAEGGSVVLLRDDGLYGIEATRAFDGAALRDLAFSAAELGRTWPPAVERIAQVGIGLRDAPEKLARLARHGRLHEIRAALSIPLVVGGAALGFMTLYNFAIPEAFDGEDEAVAAAIAGQVAVALQLRLLERQLTRERARFEHLAATDPLTGLPNRWSFQQALGGVLADGAPFAVAFVDLDGFKQVNDLHGHDAGDALLRAIARHAQVALAPHDVLARIGGDEFGVILRGAGESDHAQRAATLRAALATAFAAFDTPRPLGASIGVALHPRDASDADGLMRAADDAMYRAKIATGRGR